MSIINVQSNPEGYLARLKERRRLLDSVKNVPDFKDGVNDDDNDDGNNESDLRVTRLLARINAVLTETRHSAAHPSWSRLTSEVLGLSCTGGGQPFYNFTSYEVLPISEVEMPDVSVREEGRRYFLAETEEEWAAFEKQREKERKVRDWRSMVPEDVSALEPIVAAQSLEDEVVAGGQTTAQPKDKKAVQQKSSSQIGFRVVKKNPSGVALDVAKPKEKGKERRQPSAPNVEEPVEKPPQQSHYFAAKPTDKGKGRQQPSIANVVKPVESLPQVTVQPALVDLPVAAASTSKQPNQPRPVSLEPDPEPRSQPFVTRKGSNHIDDINDSQFLPPSFPSDLFRSTPPPRRAKLPPIERTESSPVLFVTSPAGPPPFSQVVEGGWCQTATKRPLEMDMDEPQGSLKRQKTTAKFHAEPAPQVERIRSEPAVRSSTPTPGAVRPSTPRTAVPSLTELMASNKRKRGPRASVPLKITPGGGVKKLDSAKGAGTPKKSGAGATPRSAKLVGPEPTEPQLDDNARMDEAGGRPKPPGKSLSSLGADSPPPSPSRNTLASPGKARGATSAAQKAPTSSVKPIPTPARQQVTGPAPQPHIEETTNPDVSMNLDLDVSATMINNPLDRTTTIHAPPAFTQEDGAFEPVFDSERNGLGSKSLTGDWMGRTDSEKYCGVGMGEASDLGKIGTVSDLGTEMGRRQLSTVESYPYAYAHAKGVKGSLGSGPLSLGRDGLVDKELQLPDKDLQLADKDLQRADKELQIAAKELHDANPMESFHASRPPSHLHLNDASMDSGPPQVGIAFGLEEEKNRQGFSQGLSQQPGSSQPQTGFSQPQTGFSQQEPRSSQPGFGMYNSQYDVERSVERMSVLLDRDVDFRDWVHED